MSDQRCFNIVNQPRNNVDQINVTSHVVSALFQRSFDISQSYTESHQASDDYTFVNK